MMARETCSDPSPSTYPTHALDMVEEGDKVAVRWIFAGKKDGSPVYLSAVAIYRFEGDRIAEDWGIAAKADWPMTTPSTSD